MLYERICAAAVATPWALHPEKLQVIESFLARKARGETIPEHEIQAAKQQQRRPGVTPPGGVGIVPIYGTLTQRANLLTEWSGGTSTEEAGQQLDAFAADRSINAIILDFDSPGGGVYGIAELGDKIRNVAKDKKVIGVVNSEAASAAYWLAAQASELIVTPSGQVGSLGVYQLFLDQSEALARAGVKPTVIKAGERKNAAHPYFPLDGTGREEIQSAVDEFFSMFVKAVATGRNVSQTKVREDFGKGGMVRAQKAVSVGMADSIGTFEDVLKRYGLSRGDVTPSSGRRADRIGSERLAQVSESEKWLKQIKAEEYERRREAALARRPKAGPVTTCPTQNSILWSAALHESGHAIAAIALGIPFESITVDANGGGRLEWRDYEDPKRAHDEAVAVLLQAGQAAESLCELARAQHDTFEADRRVMSLRCPDEAKQNRARETAKALVANHAPAVRLVASRLLASPTRTLTSELVAAYAASAGLN